MKTTTIVVVFNKNTLQNITKFNKHYLYQLTPFIYVILTQISMYCRHITHQTFPASVHPGSQALTCSWACGHCPRDAYVPTLQGSHVHFQSLTRMLKTHPAHSNKM